MIVGYKLINQSNAVIQSWGGTWGQCPGVPNPVILPTGEHVHGGGLGDMGSGYTLVAWEMEHPPATTDNVILERERRLALGFDYNFGDSRGTHRIGTAPQDMNGWDEVSKVASAMVVLGQPTATISITTNTGSVTVTAMEWQQILIAAAQFRRPIWTKSFQLEAMSPIPADYTNDSYWT